MKLFSTLSDHSIKRMIEEVITANPNKVAQVKDKPSMIGWFVGQVLKLADGKANPRAVNQLLRHRLGIDYEWTGMRIQGETFSPTEQESAWDAWNAGTGLHGLATQLFKARGLPDCPAAERGADAMLQKACKAGIVRYIGKREWMKIIDTEE